MDISANRPPLDPDRLGALDPDVVAGLRVELLAQAASTNTVAADRARAGAAEGLVVVAEHQTGGRGRLDRTWETPAGTALTFSLLLRPAVSLSQWPWLPLLAGYETDRALRGAGYDTRVKWPNDVLIDGRKVAGVLSEVVDSGSGPAAVVGIGINVAMTAEELPVPAATSLLVATEAADGGPQPPDRTELLVLVLQTLWEGYQSWQSGGAPAAARLAESYAAACATIGQRVRVDRPADVPLTGEATGVDADGRLVVATPDGEMAVTAGDVVHVRPV